MYKIFLQILGLALVGFGIYTYKSGTVFFASIIISDNILAVYSLIIIGAIIFVISFFGCCGSIQENNCMIICVSFI